jgi:hypothetical protein
MNLRFRVTKEKEKFLTSAWVSIPPRTSQNFNFVNSRCQKIIYIILGIFGVGEGAAVFGAGAVPGQGQEQVAGDEPMIPRKYGRADGFTSSYYMLA